MGPLNEPHPDFQAIIDDAQDTETLMKRYASMTSLEILMRAIFLEGFVSGLTGERAPEFEFKE